MPKSEKQKLKTLYVAEYLKKYSDEDHAVTANDICDYLMDEYEIKAERKSIYRDIKILRDDYEMDIEGGQGGKYRLMSREFDFDEIKILIECLNASKFLSDVKTHQLINVLKEDFMSEYQAQQINSDVFLCAETITLRKGLLFNLAQINSAMAKKLEGKPHTPQKISFKYTTMKVSRSGTPTDLERRRGERYIVSPYKLMINNDHYYLLAYSDDAQDFRHYRVDRMKNIELINEPRDGQKEFREIDLKAYARETFSMFKGEHCKVQIRFINPLYEAVLERFGDSAKFFIDDDRHFKAVIDVNLSDQFYSWICGFRKGATILYPPKVVEDFNKFLKDIQKKYESD